MVHFLITVSTHKKRPIPSPRNPPPHSLRKKQQQNQLTLLIQRVNALSKHTHALKTEEAYWQADLNKVSENDTGFARIEQSRGCSCVT